ncbi:hypothetical protein OKW41_000805 [Paraburkholderia sp. UCT70]
MRIAALTHRSRNPSPLIERSRIASPMPAAYAADRLDIQRLTLHSRRTVTATDAMIGDCMKRVLHISTTGCRPIQHRRLPNILTYG